ncbi:MAG: polysaccharide biosynthesis/export family protein [Acidobacteriota bacterium]
MWKTVLSALIGAALAVAQTKLVTPSEQGGNLPAQAVGASDLLAVAVYGAPELSRTVRVTPDGVIRLPMLKQTVGVRGLMPMEIETLLARALESEHILVDPVVTVTIAEFASRPISVVGSVRRPLTFQASGRTTLLDALTRAEGLAPEAGHTILITRAATSVGGVPLTTRIDVKSLLDNAEPEANLALEGGEEVRVPEAGRVFIVGNVMKPGSFPLSDAGGMSILKALAMVEGLSRFATKQAYIYRPGADGGAKQEIEIELRKLMDRKTPDVELLAGDIFYIPDNRRGRLTASVIDRIVSFGAGTASGALVLSVGR